MNDQNRIEVTKLDDVYTIQSVITNTILTWLHTSRCTGFGLKHVQDLPLRRFCLRLMPYVRLATTAAIPLILTIRLKIVKHQPLPTLSVKG